jgi:predicted transcriptional regulator
MENEELFDAILKKFTGDRSFSRDEIRDSSFYENLNEDYYVVENHLNFLIGQEMLKESNDRIPIVSLTRKGWYVMTNPKAAGYVAQRKEREKKNKREKATLIWAALAAIFAAGAILTWVIDKLVKK